MTTTVCVGGSGNSHCVMSMALGRIRNLTDGSNSLVASSARSKAALDLCIFIETIERPSAAAGRRTAIGSNQQRDRLLPRRQAANGHTIGLTDIISRCSRRRLLIARTYSPTDFSLSLLSLPLRPRASEVVTTCARESKQIARALIYESSLSTTTTMGRRSPPATYYRQLLGCGGKMVTVRKVRVSLLALAQRDRYTRRLCGDKPLGSY